MTEKSSKHHILPLDAQEENDKKAIRDVIETYDIEDAVTMLYIAIGNITRTGDHIDAIVNKINEETKNSRATNNND